MADDKTPHSLLTQAFAEAQRGSNATALELMHEALNLTQNQPISVSVLIICARLSLMIQAYDELPGLMQPLRAQLDYYQAKSHISGQIETLFYMAGLAFYSADKPASLGYLDAIETILHHIGENDLAQISSERGGKNLILAHHYIQTRTSKLARDRKQIHKRLK